MTTAFVLSGGGSPGSIQVVMLLGLAEAGITPGLIVGTSVGAAQRRVVNNTPVPHAVELGATEVWVLPSARVPPRLTWATSTR